MYSVAVHGSVMLCNIVQCGVTWCDLVVWCGVGEMSCGMVWTGGAEAQCDAVVWCNVVLCCVVWCGLLVWYGVEEEDEEADEKSRMKIKMRMSCTIELPVN